MLVKSAVFGSNECFGQQRRHLVQTDDDPPLCSHQVDQLAVTIENKGGLGWIVLGDIPDSRDVQLLKDEQQDSQKHGQNKTDSEHEADDMPFIVRLSALGW